jgi:hypothetical protein
MTRTTLCRRFRRGSARCPRGAPDRRGGSVLGMDPPNSRIRLPRTLRRACWDAGGLPYRSRRREQHRPPRRIAARRPCRDRRQSQPSRLRAIDSWRSASPGRLSSSIGIRRGWQRRLEPTADGTSARSRVRPGLRHAAAPRACPSPSQCSRCWHVDEHRASWLLSSLRSPQVLIERHCSRIKRRADPCGVGPSALNHQLIDAFPGSPGGLRSG